MRYFKLQQFRRILISVSLLIIISCLFFLPLIRPYSDQTYFHLNSSNTTQKKVSISHYTTLYGLRTDSNSKIFDDNLKRICEIIDPDDYSSADIVFVSAVDLIQLPTSSNAISYRHAHPSQLWLFHSEESPRNSYRKLSRKDLVQLDDWFNFTATLKPESDFPIQYRGYRIKPEIGILLRNEFNLMINSTSITSNSFLNGTSDEWNTLSSVVYQELLHRQNQSLEQCPYTCNQPLPPHLLELILPRLPSIPIHIVDRHVVRIVWFVSNCNTHSRREDFVHQLRSQTNIRVDIYGDCASMFNSHDSSDSCQKGTGNCMDKILTNYRFYLSFENSKCDHYITEKYWIQGLNRHSIPIVLGAKKEQYQRIAVPSSYIHVDDYSNVEELAKALHRLNRNDSEYLKYLRWTQIYDVSDQYAFHSINRIDSSLCLLGHYQRLQLISEQSKQVQLILQWIRKIFDITGIPLFNWNWTTARTNRIELSRFYNPDINCWDTDYPSLLKRLFNYFFLW